VAALTIVRHSIGHTKCAFLGSALSYLPPLCAVLSPLADYSDLGHCVFFFGSLASHPTLVMFALPLPSHGCGTFGSHLFFLALREIIGFLASREQAKMIPRKIRKSLLGNASVQLKSVAPVGRTHARSLQAKNLLPPLARHFPSPISLRSVWNSRASVCVSLLSLIAQS
jgi:hypothetical protein